VHEETKAHVIQEIILSVTFARRLLLLFFNSVENSELFEHICLIFTGISDKHWMQERVLGILDFDVPNIFQLVEEEISENINIIFAAQRDNVLLFVIDLIIKLLQKRKLSYLPESPNDIYHCLESNMKLFLNAVSSNPSKFGFVKLKIFHLFTIMSGFPESRKLLFRNLVYNKALEIMVAFPFNSILHNQVHLLFRAILLDKERDQLKSDPTFIQLGPQIADSISEFINSSEPVPYTEPYKAHLKLIYEDWYNPIIALSESARLRNKKAVEDVDEQKVVAQIIAEFSKPTDIQQNA